MLWIGTRCWVCWERQQPSRARLVPSQTTEHPCGGGRQRTAREAAEGSPGPSQLGSEWTDSACLPAWGEGRACGTVRPMADLGYGTIVGDSDLVLSLVRFSAGLTVKLGDGSQ